MSAGVQRIGRTAAELHRELDWAISVLLGPGALRRIEFDDPVRTDVAPPAMCNWHVDVRCRPDDDLTVEAAIRHIAERYDLI